MESNQVLTARKILRALLTPVFTAWLAGSLVAQAQPTVAPPVSAAPRPGQSNAKPASAGLAPTAAAKTAPPIAAVAVEIKPLWKELTPAQQAALKPLAANWSTIDAVQKRKWLALSNNFPALAPAEQQKMHSRMAEWTSLSKQQRDQARFNFAESNKLAPKEKAAKTASKAADWEAYQALSPEEKQKLAAKAAPKPAGAAVAPVKPLPPEKQAIVPATRLSPKPIDSGGKLSAVEANGLQPKGAGEVPAAPGTPGTPIQKN